VLTSRDHYFQSDRQVAVAVASAFGERLRGVAGRRLATASDDGTVRLWDPAAGRLLATLLDLDDGGWVALSDDGRYKLGGTPNGEFWYTIGLCRFEPGELDPYFPQLRKLPADAPLWTVGDEQM
jgi:hypothetical protein